MADEVKVVDKSDVTQQDWFAGLSSPNTETVGAAEADKQTAAEVYTQQKEQQPQAPTIEQPAPQQEQKPPPGFVPHQAMHEERARRKELEAELAQRREIQARIDERLRVWQEQQALQQQAYLQQQEQEQIPAYDEDPLGHMQARNAILERRLANIEQGTAQQQQVMQQQTWQQQQIAQQQHEFQRNMAGVQHQVNEFKREHPDYDNAFKHVMDRRDQELQMMGVGDPAARREILNQNALALIQGAVQNGKNPAQTVYELARFWGYSGNGQQQQFAQTSGMTGSERVAQLNRGVSVAGSLGNMPAAAQGGPLNYERLANMQDREFNQLMRTNPGLVESIMRGELG